MIPVDSLVNRLKTDPWTLSVEAEINLESVLDVEISFEDRNITVNGVEVAYDPAFFELVAPYMDTWKYNPADWSIDYDSIEDDW